MEVEVEFQRWSGRLVVMLSLLCGLLLRYWIDAYHSTSNFPGTRADKSGRVTIRDCILPLSNGCEGRSRKT